MTISVLQLGAENANAASATTIAQTLTLTAGSYIYGHTLRGTNVTVTPSSSTSESPTNLGTVSQAGDNRYIDHWIMGPMTGGSTTITSTYGSATTQRAQILVEIGDSSGYDSTATANVENNQGTPTTSTDAVTSTNLPTLTAQPALIVGITTNTEGDTTAAAGTGFTDHGVRTNFTGGIPDASRIESKRVTATTAAPATFTAAQNSRHLTTAVAFIENGAGGSPATLSSPTPSGTLGTTTTATLGATTDTTSGTLYTVVESTAALLVAITAAQVKAGNNNLNAAADAAGNAAVSTTTPSVGVSGLVANTAYSYASVQNSTGGDSNIVTGTFTTAAASTAKPWPIYANMMGH